MNMQSKFTLSPQAMSRTVGDETVILDLESGTYFGLDPVGARMWALIGEGKDPAEICDALLDEFDVERVRLETDFLALMADLAEHKLVIVSES